MPGPLPRLTPHEIARTAAEIRVQSLEEENLLQYHRSISPRDHGIRRLSAKREEVEQRLELHGRTLAALLGRVVSRASQKTRRELQILARWAVEDQARVIRDLFERPKFSPGTVPLYRPPAAKNAPAAFPGNPATAETAEIAERAAGCPLAHPPDPVE